jgi:OmcA/MtrC family decaheme c-type cytochrome
VLPLAIAIGVALLAPVACKKPALGEPVESGQGVGGPRIEIAAASIDGTGHVEVSLRITRGGVPVSTVGEVVMLEPRFTLATLSPHPVDGPIAAWKSAILSGAQTLARLPPSGPGTPADEMQYGVRQPGAESSGTLAGGNGVFTYAYAAALPAGFDPTETVRAGVFLLGNGTADGTSTFDFRPAGGAAAPRDVALHESCRSCHDEVRGTDGAVGVKICTTCHTWQNADPDTVDPAALDGATGATDPNPLELGRLIHRIHRGKNLPTLYAASSTAVPAPALPSATELPLPFVPGRNVGIVGRKYSIVGAQSREFVFGKIVDRIENGVTKGKLATGVVFPRDLRDCRVCHEGAPQAYEILYGISRRTCAGCHTDTWFQATPITDAAHFAHLGGPRADDSQCRNCHVAAPDATWKLYAPIAEIHVPPHLSPRHNTPVAEIVAVRNLRKGAAPTVVFKITDRVGPVVPSPNAPIPANDTRAVGTPLPRGYVIQYPTYGAYLAIMINGPTAPDYLGIPSWQVASSAPGNPNIYALVADPMTNEYTYTFNTTLPADAAGTWTVALEGYRRIYVPSPHYDAASDEFRWPYTSEPLFEAFANPLVDVDTATGEWTAASPGTTVPRRTVVTQDRCLRCHAVLPLHGGMRNQVRHCVDCHTPTATDWVQRPKVNGSVNLSATLDGIEERSVHFKVLIHRIHTGGRRGAATLEGLEPHVVYGYGGTPYFFDEGVFSSDLANCTLCHEGKTYTIESVPPDARPTVANETATITHAGTAAHVPGEPSMPPIQAACLGCHASSTTMDHARRNTLADGAEQCASCHARGPWSVDVAHGLARENASLVSASFSSIVEGILEPRCASAACHGGSPPAAFPRLDAEGAYAAIVGVDSQQAPLKLVEPFEPDASYLLVKMRGDGASVGGIGTPMPTDGLLDPSELAAIEGWIANGANDD